MARSQRAQSLFKNSAAAPVVVKVDGGQSPQAPATHDHEGVSPFLSLPEVSSNALRRGWFMGSHLLLPPGATIADIGCRTGDQAYTIAALHPEWNIVGIDLDADTLDQARQTYARDNLRFSRQNAWSLEAEDSSFDAVINAFTLHEIYSNTNLNDRIVTRTLAEHVRVLRQDGYLLLHDYVLPSAAAYVLMEFPVTGATGQTVDAMSEADLLVYFSRAARVGQHGAITGFYLEELPPHFPHTRLFRLPYKWAYEFMLRKDDRADFTANLAKEYAFYTEWDYRRELRSLGLRIVYSSPHWDESFINECCEGRFRLYREDGSPLAFPPTSQIILAQKIDNPRSVALQELRNTGDRPSTISIQAMRNDVTGHITDIASRQQELAEIIPFRLTEDGRLKVYLLDGMPRGLVNAVPRSGRNLDGRIWSGHMVEPLSLDSGALESLTALNAKQLVHQCQSNYGLTPSEYDMWMDAPPLFPDPSSLDERVITRYLRVNTVSAPNQLVTQRMADTDGFVNPSHLREYDAQAVLDAISVGLIPNARLEIQVTYLCRLLNVATSTWADSPLLLGESTKTASTTAGTILSHMAEKDGRFKAIKGTANTIRSVQSLFIEEGQDDNGGINGLAARPLDFVVPEEQTINTAIILPLSKNVNGEVMADVIVEHLPVPQRYKGNGLTVRAPSLPLPREVQSLEDARKYIAEKFEVDIKHVTRMGESYFTHIGMTPHRVYPFAITDSRGHYSSPGSGVTGLHRMKWADFWTLNWYDCDTSLITTMGRLAKRMPNHNSDIRCAFSQPRTQENAQALSLNGSYVQRSAAPKPAPMINMKKDRAPRTP
ncbi:MAG: class I SAM-dependent methyltransferase [Pseudomonadota bacterium]